MTYSNSLPDSTAAEALVEIVCRSAHVNFLQIARVSGREPMAFVWKDTLVVAFDLRTLTQHSIIVAMEKAVVARGE
jgi:hypothetical protein